MQDYKAIDENENMSDAPAQMAKNDKAIISNFSGAEEPNTKMQGQFWFDTSTNKLQFYNGSKFVVEIPCSITGAAARAKADESGRVIADTYLMKNEAKTNYLGIEDKAVSATIADKAKALNTLERNKAYKVGDIAYTTQLPAGYYLECATAGTTGDSEPSISVESENVNDGTVKWGVKNIQDASKLGLPVGFEAFTTNPNLQAGWLPLLGGEYSRTTYADLWAWVQTQAGYLIEESAWQTKAAANGGNVPFYSKGDGATTFRVPALPLAKCITGESLGVKGNGMTLGLTDGAVNFGVQRRSYTPNGYFVNPLQGQATKFGHQIGEAADLNTAITAKNLTVGLVDDAQKTGIIVDLSNQVNGLWCVKAYGTVTNVGSTDVANISTGLTEAETRISALENHGAGATVVKSYRNGTEWYRVWSDGWVEQGGLATMSYNVAHNLLKPFADTNYSVFLQLENADTHYTSAIIAHTVSSFTPWIQWTSNYSEGNNLPMYWYACGQGA